MARRKIATLESTSAHHTFKALVYRDAEWSEYIVEFYIDGDKQAGGSYHTGCREDAGDTALKFINDKRIYR